MDFNKFHLDQPHLYAPVHTFHHLFLLVSGLTLFPF